MVYGEAVVTSESIVFTTNHKEKLDPALLRPGRMDVHINMSYLWMISPSLGTVQQVASLPSFADIPVKVSIL
ncbi:putative P-loop containing nucleoside triphosphate hydrolase [Helianthus annuus]|nr:putative P-loop containing nucleoside triphosphate hydrolase [Helianthus annuus]